MFKSKLIQSRSAQLSIIGGIVLFHMLAYLIVPISINNVATETPIPGTNLTMVSWRCTLDDLSFHKVINVFYLVEANFIPFGIMVATNALITRQLFKSRKRVQTNQESRQMIARRNRDLKFGFSSIMLNVMFIILIIPVSLTYLITIDDFQAYISFFLSAVLLYYVNFGMPFFVHYLTNSVFRNAFFNVINPQSQSSINTASTNAT